MTNYQLAIQANTLVENLKTKMWQAAAASSTEEYYKLQRIYFKAVNRYERRYIKCHPDLHK